MLRVDLTRSQAVGEWPLFARKRDARIRPE